MEKPFRPIEDFGGDPYQFNMWNWGQSFGEQPGGSNTTGRPQMMGSARLSGSPFSGQSSLAALLAMAQGTPGGMKTTQPVPISTFAGTPDAQRTAVQGPAGGGVAGSGLLDPEEFNLAVKDKIQKREGPDGPSGPASMGLFSGLNSLPEGVRAAMSRIGGGVPGAQGGAAAGTGAVDPRMQMALREAMARARR